MLFNPKGIVGDWAFGLLGTALICFNMRDGSYEKFYFDGVDNLGSVTYRAFYIESKKIKRNEKLYLVIKSTDEIYIKIDNNKHYFLFLENWLVQIEEFSEIRHAIQQHLIKEIKEHNGNGFGIDNGIILTEDKVYTFIPHEKDFQCLELGYRSSALEIVCNVKHKVKEIAIHLALLGTSADLLEDKVISEGMLKVLPEISNNSVVAEQLFSYSK